jgi:hypothetical protein
MRTFLEIYNDAVANGIVDVFDKANTLKAQYLIMGWDTNSIDYDFTHQQILVLSSLQHEITGIRPGGCSGCIQDVIRRMNQWLIKNKPQNETKRKRKA